MKDFVVNLQQEIKRLKNITDDLQGQLKAVGEEPDIPDHLRPGKKTIAMDGSLLPPFKNSCPACTTFKATQRPTSAGRVRQQGEFRIRKNAASKPKRGSLAKQMASAWTNTANAPTTNEDIAQIQ